MTPPDPRRLVFVPTADGAPEPASGTTVVVLDTAWTPLPGGRPDVVSLRPAASAVLAEEDLFEGALTRLDAWGDATGMPDRMLVGGVAWWFRARETEWNWLHERILWRRTLGRLMREHGVEIAGIEIPDGEPALADVVRALAGGLPGGAAGRSGADRAGRRRLHGRIAHAKPDPADRRPDRPGDGAAACEANDGGGDRTIDRGRPSVFRQSQGGAGGSPAVAVRRGRSAGPRPQPHGDPPGDRRALRRQPPRSEPGQRDPPAGIGGSAAGCHRARGRPSQARGLVRDRGDRRLLPFSILGTRRGPTSQGPSAGCRRGPARRRDRRRPARPAGGRRSRPRARAPRAVARVRLDVRPGRPSPDAADRTAAGRAGVRRRCSSPTRGSGHRGWSPPPAAGSRRSPSSTA